MACEGETAIDDTCEAMQADDITISKLRPSLSADGRLFFIAIDVKFIYPPAFPLEGEDDYLFVNSDIESTSFFLHFWAPCKFLERHNLPWNKISKMLTRVGVPLHKQPFMVHRISACADEIASKDYNRRREVLPIMVSITVVVDYNMYEKQGAKTFAVKQAPKFSHLKAVPANEASVRALESRKIEETGAGCCRVCLDRLQIGSEVRCMPCNHVFHEGCIFNWLRVSGFCPCCRFQLPA